MTRTIILAALAAATLATPALARREAGWPADQLGQEATIPFVGTIGLYNFEADSDRGVWLQDQSRRWYYARISGPCVGLPTAVRIGVDTRFNGTQLDRTGRLRVDGDTCALDSLTKSAGPPPKAKKKG